MGLLDWCSLSGRTAADIDDLVRHLSAKGSLAEQRRRIGRRRQRADRQRHLGSRFCACMVSNICCSSVDGRDSDRAPAHPCMRILNVIAYAKAARGLAEIERRLKKVIAGHLDVDHAKVTDE